LADDFIDFPYGIQEFFAEAAAIAAGNGPGVGGGDWPSTDSEDDDYNPEGLEERPNSESEKEGKEEDSSSSSDSESESGQKVGFSNSSSDDASGKFKTPSIGKSNWDHTNSVQADSVDAGRSLDSSAEDSESPLVDRGRGSHAVSDDEGPMIVAGKRQHKAVDYKKLHDVSFPLLLFFIIVPLFLFFESPWIFNTLSGCPCRKCLEILNSMKTLYLKMRIGVLNAAVGERMLIHLASLE
jgi:hypothetical protein